MTRSEMLDTVRRIASELGTRSAEALREHHDARSGGGMGNSTETDLLSKAHSAAVSLLDAIIDALGSD